MHNKHADRGTVYICDAKCPSCEKNFCTGAHMNKSAKDCAFKPGMARPTKATLVVPLKQGCAMVRVVPRES